jgi:hypothetical protein
MKTRQVLIEPPSINKVFTISLTFIYTQKSYFLFFSVSPEWLPTPIFFSSYQVKEISGIPTCSYHIEKKIIIWH